ncbi:MAG: bis(5'-nucleosyl)-tetraphosphatase (symmetrical) YqeK [Tenericutes bacterium]|jgi:predicted HD superfamily hydrolase involved in NAD metabolism|nr:bis(5'-nucleosyl)-tetraphosphatase (symmetrical) YqeK [Mycoplasmatota bacterium]
MKSNLIENIISYLVNVFESDQDRLNHTLSVRDMALKLGKIHSVDLFRLEVAALLHDFTKNESIDDAFEMAKKKFSEDELKQIPQGCLHAYSAAGKAELVFSIDDQEIIDAIIYHCTGRIFKSRVEQIVFISDYIEESRAFVDESLRDMAIKDLDLVTYHIFNNSVGYLEKKNRNVSALSKDALSYYKNKTEVINER